MLHIGSPYDVRKIQGEVITTEVSILEGEKETRYITDTYCIDDNGDDVVFQRHRKENGQ